MYRLRKQVSRLSLPLTDRRRADKWHKDIDQIAHGHVPSWNIIGIDADLQPANFPWAHLQGCTDSYLGRKQRTEQEQDTLLAGLIESHGNKIIAFAACAHALSASAHELLLAHFAEDIVDNSKCCQAYIAAKRVLNDKVAPGDARWASVLVVVKQLPYTLSMSSARTELVLRHASEIGVPSDLHLRFRTRGLVHEELEHLRSTVQAYQSESDWAGASSVAAVLQKVSH
ncbi:hypothetical protein Slin14017_G034450 [Septoria linicola]|nr:hypothetical protein Slin14017_G034450 [Septoria linicola]